MLSREAQKMCSGAWDKRELIVYSAWILGSPGGATWAVPRMHDAPSRYASDELSRRSLEHARDSRSFFMPSIQRTVPGLLCSCVAWEMASADSGLRTGMRERYLGSSSASRRIASTFFSSGSPAVAKL